MHVVHDDVADDDRGPVSAREGNPRAALSGGQDRETAPVEDERKQIEDVLVVVDDEQGIARGRRKVGPTHGGSSGPGPRWYPWS